MDFVPSDRIVLVDIEGLRLPAWSKLDFRKIMDKWGNIVHLNDNIGEDVYKKILLILGSGCDLVGY